MAFTLVQAGTSLQLLDTGGVVATLTLPANITLAAARQPRFAIFGRYVVMVNSPSRPITIDAKGIVRVLCPRPPTTVMSLSGVAGGALTGTYIVKQTFCIKDLFGNLIAESALGTQAGPVSIAANYLKATNMDVSPDDVSSSRLYRTTTGGAVYFPWVEVDGNTQTSVQDDLSDAGLNLVAAPQFGTPPDLTLIAEWRGRLWGVDRIDVDTLRHTETNRMFAWPALNSIPIPRVGGDSRGVTALLSRKDTLGTGRLNSIWQISGNNDNAVFKPVKVTENCGVISQESVAVYLDTAYFLWVDGVYRWDNEGVKCLSDGKVRSWFATGDYFNQSKFSTSFGYVDPNTKRYKLFLCSAGSTTIDRWVEYDIVEQKWWGPHKTAAFTPSCTLIAPTANDVLIPMIGGSTGYLWKEQSTRTDDTATAIDFDVDTKRHDAGTPQTPKAWKDLRISGVPLATGRMVVTPTFGELDAVAATQPLQYDLTKSEATIGKVGPGNTCGLNFRQATAGQDVKLTGYELDFFELGNR